VRVSIVVPWCLRLFLSWWCCPLSVTICSPVTVTICGPVTVWLSAAAWHIIVVITTIIITMIGVVVAAIIFLLPVAPSLLSSYTWSSSSSFCVRQPLLPWQQFGVDCCLLVDAIVVFSLIIGIIVVGGRPTFHVLGSLGKKRARYFSERTWAKESSNFDRVNNPIR